MGYRYNLQPYKGIASRHRCPECKKSRTFALYIDNETGNSINDNTGRCNRESGCGYHYTPKQYFTDNGIENEYKENNNIPEKPKPPIAYIDKNVFNKSLTAYQSNKFVQFLHTIFDENIVASLLLKYKIGSSNTWPGATTFWYIDSLDQINYGKIMVFDPSTGKRDKVKNNHCASVLERSFKKQRKVLPDWLVKYQNNETKINCLFGEHLLKSFPQYPIAIVESEKTAIIASVYLPQFIWLACGSLGNLSPNRCKALIGKSVTLYPDLNAFTKWKEKGEFMKYRVSSILEENATDDEKLAQLDIADYLIKMNFKELQEQPVPTPEDYTNVSPELLALHAKYTEAEAAGKFENHPDASYIKSLWDGVVLYRNKPSYQQHYIELLNKIQL